MPQTRLVTLLASGIFAFTAFACGADSEVSGPYTPAFSGNNETSQDVDNTGPADSTNPNSNDGTGQVDDPNSTDDPNPTDDPTDDGCDDPAGCDPVTPVDGEGSPTADADGDGILDRDESNCARDSDFDGTPDCEDPDSDNDLIPDSVEAGDDEPLTPPVDTDEDGIPDFRDLDSDQDGIDDIVEGMADLDSDGKGNWRDTDSDGDNIRDDVETVTDSDEDGIPDYLDIDSDNDTIADWYEAFGDVDEDDIADRFDLDSDGDGISDAVEAGDSNVDTVPVDTDGDRIPDFHDLDSDGDGISDEQEIGCPAASDRLKADSDDDGYEDLAEIAVGSDPCNSLWDVYDEVEFFFILPDGEEESAPLEFSTDVQQADVHFNMDTTGSMGSEISNLRSGIVNTIIPGVNGLVSNVAFGVSSYRDFPVGDFGNSGDYPFRLDQRVTTRSSDAQAGTNALSHGGGDDGPESGWEALYQIATGRGGVSWGGGSIPSFNPAAGRIAGVADGTIGGVGFREGSLPIVIHISDAQSHSASDYGTWVTGEHSRSNAVTSLNGISARVIGIATNGSVRSEMALLARDTGAFVPACAFNNACGAGMCCTAISGGARAQEWGGCPLAFEVNGNGTGLSSRVVDAIDFLATASTMRVSTRVIADPVAARGGVDTACFIQAVLPNHATAPSSCAAAPTAADHYPPSGVLDSFDGVTPGTQVFFDVIAQNDGCVEPTDQPQAFEATIEVIGDDVTVLDSMQVTVIIPPVIDLGDKD